MLSSSPAGEHNTYKEVVAHILMEEGNDSFHREISRLLEAPSALARCSPNTNGTLYILTSSSALSVQLYHLYPDRNRRDHCIDCDSVELAVI